MRKIFCFSSLVLLFYCSCYRASNQPQKDAPVFNILQNNGSNITDSISTIAVTDSNTVDLSLTFSLLSGDPTNYPITCFISGLPAGINITTLDSVTFKLNNNISFSFLVNTDTGLYSFNVNILTATGLNTYPMHIHVLPVADGAAGLAGYYSGNDPCGHFSEGDIWYTYTATVSTLPGRPHWISIQNYRGLGDSIIVYAIATYTYPNTPWVGTINIPLQTVDGYTIYGNGTGSYGIQENQRPWISIYGDTIIHAGDTQTCYTQLKQ